MRITFAVALITVGCGGGGLPYGGDGGGPDNDGGARADLAGASCGSIAQSVSQWLDAHRACTVDADCTSVGTACGLPGQCGMYVNTGAPGAYLMSLLDGWNGGGCSEGKCTPCPLGPWGPPGCVNGVCAVKTRVPGAVGDACSGGSDCATGQCYGPSMSEQFIGGYCTIIGCSDQAPCPSGSTCKSIAADLAICLKNCDPLSGTAQCRGADNYACCSGPGPTGMVGWCAPMNSGLCLAN